MKTAHPASTSNKPSPRAVFLLAVALFAVQAARAADGNRDHEISVSGRQFLLDGAPFPYTGVSFFNAIYNPAFNRDSSARREWIARFQKYGINVLRVWCQWDNQRGFIDASPRSTLYETNGQLRAESLRTLKALVSDADSREVVIELCLFSNESWAERIRLGPAASRRAVESVARELLPWRNVAFQIWNEQHDEQVLSLVQAIKRQDSKRLVTSSPGFPGALGACDLNSALNYLTPHTSRQNQGKPWELAPKQIVALLKEYNKPVVDDEPARNGTSKFGGPKERTRPEDHILHIWEVWRAVGYSTYHHDMFQTGYGTSACPPDGIPDPTFSPYHRVVFEFLAQRERYQPSH